MYACIQSGVFTREEIDYLRSYVRTWKLPNAMIKEIAETMRCHFIVKRIDENYEVAHKKKRKGVTPLGGIRPLSALTLMRIEIQILTSF